VDLSRDFAAYRRRVGENLKRARWAAELTQEEAAANIVSYKYYQSIEQGQANSKLETLFGLSHRLNTTMSAIFETDPHATRRARERMAAARQPRRGRRPLHKR